MSPQAIAALCAALLGVAGCSPETFERNLANLEDFGSPPEQPQEPTPPKAANPFQVNTPEPPPVNAAEECVSIFRVQTCEDGVLHHLGPNMEWID